MSWVLPQLVLACPAGSEIAIVSPWIRDVPLDLPAPLRQVSPHLSHLLKHAQTELNLRITFYCREEDQYIRGIRSRLSKQYNTTLLLRPHLHAKAVVTPGFILTGSGNLLWTSIYRNEETLRLDCNERRNVRLALRHDLGVT